MWLWEHAHRSSRRGLQGYCKSRMLRNDSCKFDKRITSTNKTHVQFVTKLRWMHLHDAIWISLTDIIELSLALAITAVIQALHCCGLIQPVSKSLSKSWRLTSEKTFCWAQANANIYEFLHEELFQQSPQRFPLPQKSSDSFTFKQLILKTPDEEPTHLVFDNADNLAKLSSEERDGFFGVHNSLREGYDDWHLGRKLGACIFLGSMELREIAQVQSRLQKFFIAVRFLVA